MIQFHVNRVAPYRGEPDLPPGQPPGRSPSRWAWVSIALFIAGGCFPLIGPVPGFDALILGPVGGSTIIPWSAAPLYVSSLLAKRPTSQFALATLTMAAYLSIYWVIGEGAFEIGHYIWLGCVGVNFGRTLYLFIQQGRPRLAFKAARDEASPEFDKDGFVRYPRVGLSQKRARMSPGLPEQKEP